MHDPARFNFYDASFDPLRLIKRHAVAGLQPTPGYLTNFLGVLIDPRYLPHILEGRAGTVEAPPIPANWHADIAEWGAVLRAVDLAEGTFTAVECGCGWACWLNNAGVAARRSGRGVKLVGIEADDEYVKFAIGALATNGFGPQEFSIVRGIAAGRRGTALFPKTHTGGTDWGRAPILVDSTETAGRRRGGSTHVSIACITLDSLPVGQRVDLLHVDIQGGEVDLLRHSIAFVVARVAYLVIGTHSRQIEGALQELLCKHGFVLEIDRPAILDLTHASGPVVRVDGIQGWRNPRLARPPEQSVDA